MQIISKCPSQCNFSELKAFERLVVEGGEVSQGGLRTRIRNAKSLAFLVDEDYGGVCAIKRPLVSYKQKVFKKACADNCAAYEFELGWLYVSEAMRGLGLGRELLSAILDTLRNDTCFATTRADNVAMHSLFSEFGFTKLGSPYRSEEGDYHLVLYVKP